MPVSIGTPQNSFANPIGLLSDCHRRIERFLQTLSIVANEAAGARLDAGHRSALEAAVKYFREAAPKHTADEEEDLFPALQQLESARAGEILAELDRLEAEHETAGAWHHEVEELCQRWLDQDRLSSRDADRLRGLLSLLSDLYRSHIAMEEEKIFPLAQAELSDSAKKNIGLRMAARRGVPFRGAVV